jgi:hypothetical protein
MSEAYTEAEKLQCSMCQVRSAVLERMRQTEVLQVQAQLSAIIAERHAANAEGIEARQVALSIAEEIRRMFGEGGI